MHTKIEMHIKQKYIQSYAYKAISGSYINTNRYITHRCIYICMTQQIYFFTLASTPHVPHLPHHEIPPPSRIGPPTYSGCPWTPFQMTHEEILPLFFIIIIFFFYEFFFLPRIGPPTCSGCPMTPPPSPSTPPPTSPSPTPRGASCWSQTVLRIDCCSCSMLCKRLVLLHYEKIK